VLSLDIGLCQVEVAAVMPPAQPLQCPICDNTLSAESHPYRPFCSKRCKLLDLSRWLSEDYRVAGEPMGDGVGGHYEKDDEDLP